MRVLLSTHFGFNLWVKRDSPEYSDPRTVAFTSLPRFNVLARWYTRTLTSWSCTLRVLWFECFPSDGEFITVRKWFPPVCDIWWLEGILDISAAPLLERPLTAGQITDQRALTAFHSPLTQLGSPVSPLPLPQNLTAPLLSQTYRMCALHPSSWPLIWPNWILLFSLRFPSLFLPRFVCSAGCLVLRLQDGALNSFANKQARIWVSRRCIVFADRSSSLPSDEWMWRYIWRETTWRTGSSNFRRNILVVCFSDWVLKDYTNKRVCIVGAHAKAIGRNKLLAQDVVNMILAPCLPETKQ